MEFIVPVLNCNMNIKLIDPLVAFVDSIISKHVICIVRIMLIKVRLKEAWRVYLYHRFLERQEMFALHTAHVVFAGNVLVRRANQKVESMVHAV